MEEGSRVSTCCTFEGSEHLTCCRRHRSSQKLLLTRQWKSLFRQGSGILKQVGNVSASTNGTALVGLGIDPDCNHPDIQSNGPMGQAKGLLVVSRSLVLSNMLQIAI